MFDRNRPALWVGLFVLTLSVPVKAACIAPAWAKENAVSRKGSVLVVTCMGTGATPELSAIEARDRCDSLGALEFRNTVRVKELVVQTNKDAAVHSEVTSESCVVGMICSDPKVASCNDQGVSQTWRSCIYEIEAVRAGTPDDCKDQVKARRSTSASRQDTIANRNELGEVNSKIKSTTGHYEHAKSYLLRISVVPSCDDIVISGATGRNVRCTTNPVTVPVRHDDRELIIRASGYLPKTILLNNKNEGSESHVNVYLDLAD